MGPATLLQLYKGRGPSQPRSPDVPNLRVTIAGIHDPRRARSPRVGMHDPWGPWHLWGLNFEPPPPLEDPLLFSPAIPPTPVTLLVTLA